jgi:nucleotide-binding universal stress UspA family protein
MKKFRKIMVACDLCTNPDEGLDYAAELAEENQAELVVVNVIHQRDVDALQKVAFYNFNFPVEKYLKCRINEHLIQIEQLLKGKANIHFPIKKIIKVGIPYQEIIQTAEKEDIDLVILGPENQSIFSHLLYGSTANKLLRHCPVPLLRVPLTARKEVKKPVWHGRYEQLVTVG